MKKIIKMTIAIVLVMSMAFVTFGGTFDSAIKEMVALKDYISTYGGTTAGYKTALEIIEHNNSDGSYSGRYIVKFGEYPQTGTSDMAKQPIDWIVLEKSGGKALLISKYVLDCKPFIKDKEMCYLSNNPNAGWETSDLRKWLNNDFYNTAFDSMDKSQIIPYSLTGDNIFILNEAEMNGYFVLSRRDWSWNTNNDNFFDIHDENKGNPWCATELTNYAKSKNGHSAYWLRDYNIEDVVTGSNKPHYGDKKIKTATTTKLEKGQTDKTINAYSSSEKEYGVRPCVWVTYDGSVKSDREQGLEDLAGGIGKQIIGGALDSVLPGSSLLIP